MSNRLNDFVKELKAFDMTNYDIACALSNGDIERPEWMGLQEKRDGVKIWDKEEGGSHDWGFTFLG